MATRSGRPRRLRLRRTALRPSTDGKVDYTPANSYVGPDTFDYTVSDGNGGTDTGTVNVTVNGVNHPPVAVDDSATTVAGTLVTVDVVANDTDVDQQHHAFPSAPAHGTAVVSNGKVNYTPTGETGEAIAVRLRRTPTAMAARTPARSTWRRQRHPQQIGRPSPATTRPPRPQHAGQASMFWPTTRTPMATPCRLPVRRLRRTARRHGEWRQLRLLACHELLRRRTRSITPSLTARAVRTPARST